MYFTESNCTIEIGVKFGILNIQCTYKEVLKVRKCFFNMKLNNIK